MCPVLTEAYPTNQYHKADTMKLVLQGSSFFIQSNPAMTDRAMVQAVAAELVANGYENTQCGCDDEHEYYELLVNKFVTQAEAKEDYAAAKAAVKEQQAQEELAGLEAEQDAETEAYIVECEQAELYNELACISGTSAELVDGVIVISNPKYSGDDHKAWIMKTIEQAGYTLKGRENDECEVVRITSDPVAEIAAVQADMEQAKTDTKQRLESIRIDTKSVMVLDLLEEAEKHTSYAAFFATADKAERFYFSELKQRQTSYAKELWAQVQDINDSTDNEHIKQAIGSACELWDGDKLLDAVTCIEVSKVIIEWATNNPEGTPEALQAAKTVEPKQVAAETVKTAQKFTQDELELFAQQHSETFNDVVLMCDDANMGGLQVSREKQKAITHHLIKDGFKYDLTEYSKVRGVASTIALDLHAMAYTMRVYFMTYSGSHEAVMFCEVVAV